MNKNVKKLSKKYLMKIGFSLVEESPFKNYNLPYFAKNGVLLFYNTPVTKFEKSNFLIGYGEMRNGKYHAVTFRWISTRKELSKIYKQVTGYNL